MDKVSILISRVELLLKSGYEKRLNIEELFHWQSQSRTTEESITGQRYINQAVHSGNVLFFVREYKEDVKFASPLPAFTRL